MSIVLEGVMKTGRTKDINDLNQPATSHATIQPDRQNVFTDAKVAILFKELTNSSLDLISDLLHKRKFKPGVVNMIKTHVRKL